MRLPRRMATALHALVLATAVSVTGLSVATAAPDPQSAVTAAVPTVPTVDGFIVKPYLTHPGTDRMSVMFEPEAASVGPTMAVEYRPAGTEAWTSAPALLEPARGGGVAAISVYRADISGLESNTVYEYRTVTAAGTTPVASFTTWPDEDDGVTAGRFIGLSDVQLTADDGHHFNAYRDILTDAVDKYCGGVPADCDGKIAGIVVPGDLVDQGGQLHQWRNRWFGPGDFIFRHIPQIAAIGNHDTPINNYLYYFDTPDNGSPAYDEEWYSLDYLNMKLITMQSASVTTQSYQLQNDFLAAELAEATANGQDYVFLQFHHPCKSELWIPGESSAACNWVRMAETWSQQTGKTSGHLYGHTHAYSRGQSRDSSHLWVNVASAGGWVDDWGDYEMADYDEMDMSWDEMGYTTLEFSTQGAPKVRIQRHTWGDDHEMNPQRFTDATVRDDVTVDDGNQAPATPTAEILPGGLASGGATSASPQVTVPDPILHAAFSDSDDESLYEAHWQVRTAGGGYADPVYDVWGTETRSRNIWFRDDKNAGIQNEYWRAPYLDNGNYCYRVRHRDDGLAWSGWSDELCFSVAGTTTGPDLVVNGGAENGTDGWTVTGRLESLVNGGTSACSGDGSSTGWGDSFQPLAAHTGTRLFSVGGCSSPVATATASQDIDLSAYAEQIDAGKATGVLRAATRTMTKWDAPTVRAIVRDADGGVVNITRPLINQTDEWRDETSSVLLPPGSRSVVILMTGTRQRGGSNDSFVDDVRFQVAGSDLAREPYDAPVASKGNGMSIMTDWNETWPIFGAGDWNDPVQAQLTGVGTFAGSPLFAPGQTQRVRVKVANPSLHAITDLDATLTLPEGWSASPDPGNPTTATGGGDVVLQFEVTAPTGAERTTAQITAEVTGTRNGSAVTAAASLTVNIGPDLTGSLLGEDFDDLELKPGVQHNGAAGMIGWTQEGPEGWTITNAPNMPQGVTEMQGWSFMTKDFWMYGDDQERSSFARGMGVVAVADPDEWDDTTPKPDSLGRFDSTLETPAVDLPEGATDVRLRWDNHYRQEEPMEASVVVEFDTGERVRVVHWGPTTSQTPERAEMNKPKDLTVPVPSGATAVTVEFRVFNAMNDWYWSIDNVQVDAVLADGVDVTGTVSSSAGGPVAEPCVYLYETPDAPSAAYASCGFASGEFGLLDVAPGDYTVAVTDPSGAHATWWSEGPVTVEDGMAPLQITLEALTTGSVEGAVTDADGPLAGVCVYAYPADDGSAARYATCTAADGSYWQGGVDNGAYDVAFFDPTGGHATQWWTGALGGAPGQGGAVAVDVAAGEAVTGVDAVMAAEPTGSVAGVVTGPSGPVAGACVYLYTSQQAASASYATCTGADGSYWIGGIDAGDYQLAAADPSGAHRTTWQSVTVAGATTADVAMDAARGGVSGRVTGSGGAPVGGACVYLYPADVSAAAAFASCAQADGSYLVPEVESGGYDVAFFDPAAAYATQWWTGSPGGSATQSGAVAVPVAASIVAGVDARLSPAG